VGGSKVKSVVLVLPTKYNLANQLNPSIHPPIIFWIYKEVETNATRLTPHPHPHSQLSPSQK
jgi:hypothetical protein